MKASGLAVTWHTDPAASGPRERAFIGGWELLAYHDGHWAICAHGFSVARGVEGTVSLAQERALRVHAALASPITETREASVWPALAEAAALAILLLAVAAAFWLWTGY